MVYTCMFYLHVCKKTMWSKRYVSLFIVLCFYSSLHFIDLFSSQFTSYQRSFRWKNATIRRKLQSTDSTWHTPLTHLSSKRVKVSKSLQGSPTLCTWCSFNGYPKISLSVYNQSAWLERSTIILGMLMRQLKPNTFSCHRVTHSK